MYLTRTILEEVEQRFGRPAEATAATEFTAGEFRLLERCARTDRAHDVTLLILGADGRLALIRKPSYPPDVFRPPSGGIEPGETLEAGAKREALEETGLEIRLQRYLLRVRARFTCDGREAPWTTHVFLARTTGGELQPQDRKEIAEARWASVEEIAGLYRPAMLRWGTAGMRYRVDLQDWGLWLTGLAEAPEPEPDRVLHVQRDEAAEGRGGG